MKKAISRVLMCALLLGVAGVMTTGAWADDAKFDNKQLHEGLRSAAKGYKELHTAYVAYITGYIKNSEQSFHKALEHLSSASEHFAKAEVTKEQAHQIDNIVKHLNEGNKQFDEFVKALDNGKPKNAEQNLNQATEQYGKAMDLM